MKKSGFGAALMLAAILLLWLPDARAAVRAAEAVSVRIPAAVALEGTEPQLPDSFNIKLEPVKASSPMPAGGDSPEILTLQGGEDRGFFEISYAKPGIYQYLVYQLAGEASCSYDDTVYHLTVAVTTEGNGLSSSAVLYRDEESAKLEEAIFDNIYSTEPETKPTGESEPPTANQPGTPAAQGAAPVSTGAEDFGIIYAVGMAASLLVIIRMWKRIWYQMDIMT